MTQVSSAELFEKLDALASRLEWLWEHVGRLGFLNPEPYYVYKPKKDGKGAALRCDLRLEVQWTEKGFVKKTRGGVFVDLAAQEGKGENDDFARFGWDSPTKVTAKLGPVDLAAILTAMRAVRVLGRKVPEPLRKKDEETGTTVSLFHRFVEEGKKSTSAIELQFLQDGSYFRVSKSAELRRSIKLSLTEEFQLERYLLAGLDRMHAAGLR